MCCQEMFQPRAFWHKSMTSLPPYLFGGSPRLAAEVVGVIKLRRDIRRHSRRSSRAPWQFQVQGWSCELTCGSSPRRAGCQHFACACRIQGLLLLAPAYVTGSRGARCL
jgi:hypothetical protein